LPEGEVPGHDRQDRAQRLVAHEGPGGADRGGVRVLVGQEGRGVLGVEAEGPGALVDLGRRGRQRLAHLERHQQGDLVAVPLEHVRGPPAPPGPLVEARRAVAGQGLAHPPDGLVHLLGGVGLVGADHLARGRVHRREGHGPWLPGGPAGSTPAGAPGRPQTTAIAWRAMASSSSVGTTMTVTAAPSGEMTRAPPTGAALRSGSTVMPRWSSPAVASARTTGSFSPTPAVNTRTSSPPMIAV